MMKKLLILMLVLGMASTASALYVESSVQTWGFAMDVTGSGTGAYYTGDTITIDIYAGDSNPVSTMLDTILNISAASGIGSVTQGTPASWSTYAASTSGDGSGGYDVLVNGSLASDIPLDALVYSVSFTAGAAGDVYIDAVSGSWSGLPAYAGPIDGYNDGTSGMEIYGLPNHSITVVPEPMTIALLGLGGLFLLRRRK